MSETITAAIVDYGLGNLFSVKHACQHVGMSAEITADQQRILAADVVILPGVGAYEDAMHTLHRLDLVQPLRDIAASGKPLVGICLGLQLFMTESHEFGVHRGLDLIAGAVVPFENPAMLLAGEQRRLKVPQVGWNQVCPVAHRDWQGTPLADQAAGAAMYFVHSFYARPQDEAVVLATATYGGIEFCAAVQHNNLFACQFHPERSGPQGLKIYARIAEMSRATQTA